MKPVKCPKCLSVVAYLVKVAGQMMCVDCAAEREKILHQLDKVSVRGR